MFITNVPKHPHVLKLMKKKVLLFGLKIWLKIFFDHISKLLDYFFVELRDNYRLKTVPFLGKFLFGPL